MSDENKPDALDDGDDLLSDFNDLFPEESGDEHDELVLDDSADDLDSLLEDLDAPAASDEDDIDSLLDGLDGTVDLEDLNEEPTENSDDAQADEPAADEDDDIDSLLDALGDANSGEDTTEASAESADDSDDLDSLLDGLEEHVDEITSDDAEDDLDGLLDEMITESEPAAERELDIEADELDLSVDSDDELISEPIEAVETAEEMSSFDDLISNEETPLPENDLETAPAAEAPAPIAAPVTESKEEPTEEPAKKGKKKKEKSAKSSSGSAGIMVYLLLIIALGVAGGAAWMVLQLQQAAESNKAQIAQLQAQGGAPVLSDSGYNPQIDQNSSYIRDLDQRINELSTMVDGPLSHINSSNEEMMSKYEERIQQLEQQMSELKSELKKRPSVVASTTSAPLIIKNKTRTSAKTGKLWAVNLLSLSSRKRADDAVKRLQKAGINASRNRFAAKDGKTWYRVRVAGFSSYEAGKAYVKEMPKVKGISQTWVTAE